MIRFLILVFITAPAFSQQQLPIAANFLKSYRTGVRDSSGSPGKNYWQNNADYNIAVRFSPQTRLVSGHVSIQYTNNSPDTLSKIVCKLYPNLYQAEAIRTKPIPKEDLGNGVTIDSVFINGHYLSPKSIAIRGTNMTLKGVTLLPKGALTVDIIYSYTLNKGSFIRTGQVDPGAFVVAYFFPRIAVYDDIDGWNEYPYMGYDEFYNDYGNFHVEITVPGDYQVWCTGTQTNANKVFTQAVLQKIQEASTSDGITDIITETDITNRTITQPNAWNTWVFEAPNVPDVAFCTSNHYIWKSTSIIVDPKTNRRVSVNTVYNPEHTSYEPVIDYARKTVYTTSFTFPGVPFPYPHETIFDGLDAMEYPMMVNNLPWSTPQETVEFTAHEIFHTLFPFYVGTNETKYAFMDEGLATLSEFTLHTLIAPEVPMQYDISVVNKSAGADYDNPIMTLTPQLNTRARYANKDLKPALGFLYVKELLGDAGFSEALRYFIDQWKGRHPSPYDLFQCINTKSGKNLNWFWQDWFLNRIAPDLAIRSVAKKHNRYTIEVQKSGPGIVPIHLLVTLEDGTTERIQKDIGVWATGNDTYRLKVETKEPIKEIILGNAFDVDVNPRNNIWTSGL